MLGIPFINFIIFMLYMKFIITESKLTNVIETYLNNLIKSNKFDWVDKIDINLDSTLNSGWKEDYPLYNYTIYFKDVEIPSYDAQSNLFDNISFSQKFIFGGLGTKAYFTTKSVLPDGKISSFPYFKF